MMSILVHGTLLCPYIFVKFISNLSKQYNDTLLYEWITNFQHEI
jgi:hypothetical protein